MDVMESIMFPPVENHSPDRGSIHQSIKNQFIGESIALRFHTNIRQEIIDKNSFDANKIRLPGLNHSQSKDSQLFNDNPSVLDPSDPNYKLLKSLFLIYDKNSVLLNQRINEKSLSDLKNFMRKDAKKFTAFFVETQVVSPRHQKVKKAYKVLLSKIVKFNGKVYLFVVDIEIFTSLMISLESLFENPSKSHIIDPQTGYAFLYDNRGTISVIVAKIYGEWKEKTTDKDRKICQLTIFDKRVDPTLHLINNFDGSLLLFVVGGHENGSLMQDIQVFSLNLNFEREMNSRPVIRLKLRYPRLQPLIYHMKSVEENDTRLYILGGMSLKNLKKEGINARVDLLDEGKKSCETISLRKIYEAIYKKEITRNNSYENNEFVAMDKSFQVFGNQKLLKKLETFCEGGVIKLRTGFHAKNKTAFIIGVGKSKGSVYHIEYVDETGQQLHIVKKLQNIVQPGFLCNAMFRVKEKKLFFLTDGPKEKYEIADLELFERKKIKGGCQCSFAEAQAQKVSLILDAIKHEFENNLDLKNSSFKTPMKTLKLFKQTQKITTICLVELCHVLQITSNESLIVGFYKLFTLMKWQSISWIRFHNEFATIRKNLETDLLDEIKNLKTSIFEELRVQKRDLSSEKWSFAHLFRREDVDKYEKLEKARFFLNEEDIELQRLAAEREKHEHEIKNCLVHVKESLTKIPVSKTKKFLTQILKEMRGENGEKENEEGKDDGDMSPSPDFSKLKEELLNKLDASSKKAIMNYIHHVTKKGGDHAFSISNLNLLDTVLKVDKFVETDEPEQKLDLISTAEHEKKINGFLKEIEKLEEKQKTLKIELETKKKAIDEIEVEGERRKEKAKKMAEEIKKLEGKMEDFESKEINRNFREKKSKNARNKERFDAELFKNKEKEYHLIIEEYENQNITLKSENSEQKEKINELSNKIEGFQKLLQYYNSEEFIESKANFAKNEFEESPIITTQKITTNPKIESKTVESPKNEEIPKKNEKIKKRFSESPNVSPWKKNENTLDFIIPDQVIIKPNEEITNKTQELVVSIVDNPASTVNLPIKEEEEILSGTLKNQKKSRKFTKKNSAKKERRKNENSPKITPIERPKEEMKKIKMEEINAEEKEKLRAENKKLLEENKKMMEDGKNLVRIFEENKKMKIETMKLMEENKKLEESMKELKRKITDLNEANRETGKALSKLNDKPLESLISSFGFEEKQEIKLFSRFFQLSKTQIIMFISKCLEGPKENMVVSKNTQTEGLAEKISQKAAVKFMKKADIKSFSEVDDDFNNFKEKYYVRKEIKKPENEGFPSLITTFSNDNKTTESHSLLTDREKEKSFQEITPKVKKEPEMTRILKKNHELVAPKKEIFPENIDEIDDEEEIKTHIQENFAKSKYLFKYPFHGISEFGVKDEEKSKKHREFNAVLDKLIRLHKKCGPNCEHLRRFFKQLGIQMNQKPRSMMMSKTVFDKLPDISMSNYN